MRHAAVLASVFVGGALGTSARALIDATFAESAPWQTLAINVVGSFLLGALVARVFPGAPDWLRAGLGTGLLGGFTTFSALALTLATREVDAVSIGYAVASLVLGLLAAWAGLRLGRGRALPVEATS